jgi:crotonobetainyl-CoA:carnitine CoA-transferase CaiB-like acyl-CoA transferase
MAPPYLAVNGNKKSLTLDLQKPAAREIALKLAAQADIVMETSAPASWTGWVLTTRRCRR